MKRKMSNLFPKTPRHKRRRLAERREHKRLKKIGKNRAKPSDSRRFRASNGKPQPRPDNGEIDFRHDIDIYKDENRANLIRNCRDIRDNQNSHIHLKFEQPEMKISAAGMMLLYAEVYRKATTGKNVKITCNYPLYRKAEEVMQHIGFFRMIDKAERISEEKIRESDEDVRSWQVVKNTRDAPEEVDAFLSRVADIPKKRREQIYGAIKELIANASEHAYREEDAMRNWVMFGRKTGTDMSIVVGDLGRTIPVTILEHPQYMSTIKKYKELGRDIPRRFRGDSRLIVFATDSGERGTRTRYSHRGLGLKQAIEKIRKIQGNLQIYSRGGTVRFSPKRVDPVRKNLESPIQGTIIEIWVPVGDGNSASA